MHFFCELLVSYVVDRVCKHIRTKLLYPHSLASTKAFFLFTQGIRAYPVTTGLVSTQALLIFRSRHSVKLPLFLRAVAVVVNVGLILIDCEEQREHTHEMNRYSHLRHKLMNIFAFKS